MAINNEQTNLYTRTMNEAKKSMEACELDIERELKKTREKLVGLQESKDMFWRIYQSAATILGKKTELKNKAQPPNPEVIESKLLENNANN